MSKFVVFITFNGRHKTELEIDPNDSIRSLMTQIFDKFNIPESERNYNRDKFTLTNNSTLLNADQDWLNKTVKDAKIEEDDGIDLKDASSVKWG
jgi:hypothetical protein